jgi:hypothetical protein
MDLILAVGKKSLSSLILIVTLALASFVLYSIIYYILEQNPLLPLEFDFAIYVICLAITIVFVSIPSLIVHKMKVN